MTVGLVGVGSPCIHRTEGRFHDGRARTSWVHGRDEEGEKTREKHRKTW